MMLSLTRQDSGHVESHALSFCTVLLFFFSIMVLFHIPFLVEKNKNKQTIKTNSNNFELTNNFPEK
jgi:lipopolysaccharide export system protein LptA